MSASILKNAPISAPILKIGPILATFHKLLDRLFWGQNRIILANPGRNRSQKVKIGHVGF